MAESREYRVAVTRSGKKFETHFSESAEKIDAYRDKGATVVLVSAKDEDEAREKAVVVARQVAAAEEEERLSPAVPLAPEAARGSDATASTGETPGAPANG
jgi:hypothetical protein